MAEAGSRVSYRNARIAVVVAVACVIAFAFYSLDKGGVGLTGWLLLALFALVFIVVFEAVYILLPLPRSR